MRGPAHIHIDSAMQQMHKGEYAKITLFYTRQQRTLCKIFATLLNRILLCVCGGDVALQVIGIIIFDFEQALIYCRPFRLEIKRVVTSALGSTASSNFFLEKDLILQTVKRQRGQIVLLHQNQFLKASQNEQNFTKVIHLKKEQKRGLKPRQVFFSKQ